MRTAVIRREQFNSAHRLYNPSWSNEKNDSVFGLCNNPNYHGHNYQLEVKVIGDVDPETGYVIDLDVLKKIIRDEVIEPYDHRNLNLDTEDFKTLIPTAENIALMIYNRLRNRLDDKYEIFIKLSETERNMVEYPV